jgi:putative ABC transport system ATP-binding protein
MISLSHVTKTFNAGRSNQFTAVDDISIQIKPLNLTVLKGPSGSGKTTLLSLIGCMIRPSSGRIALQGITTTFSPNSETDDSFDVSSLPERFLTEIRRSTFGFIFQHFNLIKGISVLENILLPAYPTGENHTSSRKRAMELLELFDMQRHAASRVDLLSGGELQRVAIARALINNPSILVADEPTAHLDSRLSQEFMKIIATLKAEGMTILIASHDPIVYESSISDTVIEMRDGRITGVGQGP